MQGSAIARGLMNTNRLVRFLNVLSAFYDEEAKCSGMESVAVNVVTMGFD